MSDRWICAECGEKNIPERVNCYSCLAFKPGPRTPPGPVPQTPPDPPDHSNGISSKKTWSCKFCNSINNNKTKECYLCSTVRPSRSSAEDWVCRFCRTSNGVREEDCRTCNAVREASVRTPNNVTPEVSVNDKIRESSVSDEVRRPSVSDDVAEALISDGVREASVSTPTTPSEPDVDYWLCSVCSYKASHGPHCFQCGSVKNPGIQPCPGNWQCSKCQTTNFAKRVQCYSCHKKLRKRSPASVPVTCPTCKFCNQPSSKECLLCGSALPAPPPKPAPQKRRMLKTSSSSGSAPLPIPLPHCSTSGSSNHVSLTSNNVTSNNIPKNLFITPKDWKCQSCDYKNIALRNFCKDCDTPRKCIAKLYIKYKKHGISALTNVPRNDKCLISPPPQSPLKSPLPVTTKSSLRGCSKCGRPHEGPHHVCRDCNVKLIDQPAPSTGESVMLKKCAECGTECDGQYCYTCAKQMGIRLERDTWECQNCHLVDENTAICMGCGHNKAESAVVANKFLTCNHCQTKNHPHKSNCVRCMKVLAKKEVSWSGAEERPAVKETWTCVYCEISVLAKCTHCRGCNRARVNAAKEGKEKGGSVEEEEEEEGEWVEEEQYSSPEKQHQPLPVNNNNNNQEQYFEEEYSYSPRPHFLPPPPMRQRYPPPGPPRLPPRFSQPRYPPLRPLLPHRPRHPPHQRLRVPSHRPRATHSTRRQPMNLMLQPGQGH